MCPALLADTTARVVDAGGGRISFASNVSHPHYGDRDSGRRMGTVEWLSLAQVSSRTLAGWRGNYRADRFDVLGKSQSNDRNRRHGRSRSDLGERALL